MLCILFQHRKINGNLTAANQTDTSTISSFYDNLNNMTSTSQNNQLYEYTYKTTGNKHLLETVENDGITMEFSYDSAGNVTGTIVRGIITTARLSSQQIYTDNGNHLALSEDTNGIAAFYAYNPRELLISSNLSVGEIAARCGFDDLFYFSNLFRRLTGISPRGYRAGVRSIAPLFDSANPHTR